MTNKPYSFSFTTGTLLLVQSVLLAERYLELGNWQKVRELVKNTNLLQAKTVQSNIRLASEIISRLTLLCDEEMQRLVQTQQKDQRYILWLAICKRYQYIADFTVEVMGAAVNTPEKKITRPDYQAFFEQKAAFHPSLLNTAESTRRKVLNFIFKMAEQAGIIDGDGRLLPVIVTPGNRLFFDSLSPQERQFFPGLRI
jgi:hypothetical protein